MRQCIYQAAGHSTPLLPSALNAFHLLYQDDLRTAGAEINTDVSRRAGHSVSNSHHFDPARISPVTDDHCKRKLL